jgi:hypothetical protein
MATQNNEELKNAAKKALRRWIAALSTLFALIVIPTVALFGLMIFAAVIWNVVTLVGYIMANHKHRQNQTIVSNDLRRRILTREEIARNVRNSRERKERQSEINRQRGLESKKKHQAEKKLKRTHSRQKANDQSGDGVNSEQRGRLEVQGNPNGGYTETKDFGEAKSESESIMDTNKKSHSEIEHQNTIPSNAGSGDLDPSFEVFSNQSWDRFIRVNRRRKNPYIFSDTCGTCSSQLNSSGICGSCRPLEE